MLWNEIAGTLLHVTKGQKLLPISESHHSNFLGGAIIMTVQTCTMTHGLNTFSNKIKEGQVGRVLDQQQPQNLHTNLIKRTLGMFWRASKWSPVSISQAAQTSNDNLCSLYTGQYTKFLCIFQWSLKVSFFPGSLQIWRLYSKPCSLRANVLSMSCPVSMLPYLLHVIDNEFSLSFQYKEWRKKPIQNTGALWMNGMMRQRKRLIKKRGR